MHSNTTTYRLYNHRTNSVEANFDTFKRALDLYDNWSDDLDGYEGYRCIQERSIDIDGELVWLTVV